MDACVNSDSLELEERGQECPPRPMTRHRPAHPSFPTHSRSGGLNRELQPQVDKTKNIWIVAVIHLNPKSHIRG